jgi:hypothetical protein
MFDQEANEQQPSETLTSEKLTPSIFMELREEEQLEAVTGRGGVFSRSQPEPEPPLQGWLVRTPNGKLMRSPHGNLIVAIQRSLSESRIPVQTSSEQATSPRHSTSSTDSFENAFHHAITNAM